MKKTKKLGFEIVVSNISGHKINEKYIKKLTQAVFTQLISSGPISGDKKLIEIAFVTPKDSAKLNKQYRQKNLPTNILSFNYGQETDFIDKKDKLWGQLILCPTIIEKEALKQQITPVSHMTHLIVHGILHLFGYSHAKHAQAKRMKKAETRLLKKIGKF